MLHIAIGDVFRGLDQAISKRGFTVVDVGHDGEIADFGVSVMDGDMIRIWGLVKGFGGWRRVCPEIAPYFEVSPWGQGVKLLILCYFINFTAKTLSSYG